MGANLLPVWAAIELYLAEGISVMPIQENKVPFPRYEWKQYQRRIIQKETLFHDLDKLNSAAVATICGAVSGNLEIIDVDIKNKENAGELLFESIKTLYPELLERVRIHQTPSGGFHIIYRCTEPVPGSQKLASRPNIPGATPKNLCFIETRGEGGYCVAPPALGYTLVKPNTIPVLTPEERAGLLQCCKELDETIEETVKANKATAQESLIYDLTPFDDFNERCDPVQVADGEGWRVLPKRSHKFIWFTRPGKTAGVSMSFNLEKRFFYCFTSSTDLQPDKGYTPANFLALSRFNGDKKQLYDYLTAECYGKIKNNIEKKLIRKAALNNEPLPPNISEAGKEYFNTSKSIIAASNPYGTFWFEGRFGTAVDREALLTVCNGLGFRLYLGEIYRIDEQILYRQTEREFFDAVKDYIKEPELVELNEIYNAWECFIEAHGKFTVTRLPQLHPEDILTDGPAVCYKCYENGILKITPKGIELLDYSFTTLYILSTSLLPRPFLPIKDAELSEFKYPAFLRLAIGPITPYIFSVLGYLAHEYKDETTAYIILLSEQCENPREGGGSGKNIFSNLLKKITTFHSKPGSGIKYDEKFLQSWNGQRVMCISDVEKDFKFMFLKELSSGAGLQKKLFANEREVSVEEMPKFIVSSNYSFETIDGGVKRRVMPVEFTNFFTQAGGVDIHFKAHFPNGWEPADWNAFDSILAKGVFLWLSGGLKLYAPELTAGGWAKQFQQTFGNVITGFIKEKFGAWLELEQITNEEFKKEYEDYIRETGTSLMYKPSMHRMNLALTEYCKREGVAYESDVVKSINGIKIKCRVFHKVSETPF